MPAACSQSSAPLTLTFQHNFRSPGGRRIGDEREATTSRVMSRAPGNLLLREARERRLKLAQEGRVADVLEAEAPAADRRAGTVEEHPRSEVPIYRSAGQCGDDGPPHGMRVSASNRRLRHDRSGPRRPPRVHTFRQTQGDLSEGSSSLPNSSLGHSTTSSIAYFSRSAAMARYDLSVSPHSLATLMNSTGFPAKAGEINRPDSAVSSCRMQPSRCCGAIYDKESASASAALR